jgi:phage terminase large subunit GpA-like protein
MGVFSRLFRRFISPSRYAGWEVEFADGPSGIVVLTAAIDTHRRDGETFRKIAIYGWGRDRFPHQMGEFDVAGSPGQADADALIDLYLGGTMRRPDGKRMGISATAVDIGGHYAEGNLAFCQDRRRSNVWAVKAGCGPLSRAVWPLKPSRTAQRGHTFYRVDVGLARNALGIPKRMAAGRSASLAPYAYAALCGLLAKSARHRSVLLPALGASS